MSNIFSRLFGKKEKQNFEQIIQEKTKEVSQLKAQTEALEVHIRRKGKSRKKMNPDGTTYLLAKWMGENLSSGKVYTSGEIKNLLEKQFNIVLPRSTVHTTIHRVEGVVEIAKGVYRFAPSGKVLEDNCIVYDTCKKGHGMDRCHGLCCWKCDKKGRCIYVCGQGAKKAQKELDARMKGKKE